MIWYRLVQLHPRISAYSLFQTADYWFSEWSRLMRYDRKLFSATTIEDGMILMHLDQNVPNSSYSSILLFLDLEQRLMWPKWHFATFLKIFWPDSRMPQSYVQKSVFGVFTNVHNLTPFFDIRHKGDSWKNEKWEEMDFF